MLAPNSFTIFSLFSSAFLSVPVDIMGRSSHKSRKRSRSPSRGRSARLEEKLSRLIDVLSERKVKTPRVFSRSSSRSSILADHNALASGSEYIVEDLPIEELSRASLDTIGGTLAMPASQERLSVPHVSGMSEIPRSVRSDSGIGITLFRYSE